MRRLEREEFETRRLNPPAMPEQVRILPALLAGKLARVQLDPGRTSWAANDRVSSSRRFNWPTPIRINPLIQSVETDRIMGVRPKPGRVGSFGMAGESRPLDFIAVSDDRPPS